MDFKGQFATFRCEIKAATSITQSPLAPQYSRHWWVDSMVQSQHKLGMFDGILISGQ